MSHPARPLAQPALRRSGLLRALFLLGLLGLLWSWNLAQASPAQSELSHFLPELAMVGAVLEPAAELGPEFACRKPAAPKKTPAELLLHEVDQAVLMRWQLCRLLTQALPPADVLPRLPEIGPQPLLRPPAAQT